MSNVVTAQPATVAQSTTVAEPARARQPKQRRVIPKKREDPSVSEDEEPSFASIMRSTRIIEAMAERRKSAERSMADDPEAAVSDLVQLAALTTEDLGYWRPMLETSVSALRELSPHERDGAQSLALGRTLFELGRFQEAETALREALAFGLAKPEDQVAGLCWAGAAARLTGAEARAVDDVARAANVIEQRRNEARVAAARQASQLAERKQAAADRAAATAAAAARRRGTPSDVGNSLTPWDALLGGGVGGAPAEQTDTTRAHQEYLAASAAYEAEQARFDAEMDWAQQSAGRLGALGVQSTNPRPVDQGVYRRYLNARQAYDATRRGY